MKNLENNLQKEEKIIHKAQVHKLIFAKSITICVIGLLCLIGFWPLGIILICLGLCWGISAFITYSSTSLFLTDKRLIGSTGLINSKTMETPLNKLNNVSISSNLWGKIFGYASIDITTSSGNYHYHGISAGDAFKNLVMSQIEIYEEEKIKKQAMEMAQAMNNAQLPN